MTAATAGPKYLAVREHLRRRVAAMPEGALLPPEPTLCAEYGVSRITLRRAVDGLVADGHLVREQGRGTYVTRPAIRHEYRESFVHRIAGWSSVMAEQGAQVGTTVLRQRVVPAPPGVAADLGLDVAEDVVELERLRSVDGAPNHVAHSFLPADRYPKAAVEDFSEGSLYEFLRREYGADLAHARIVVDVGTAAPDEADLLQIAAGSPLLVVRTTVHDGAGQPLVHSFSRLRPDVSQVEFEVSVTGR
ncbi:GntR family transcriptional regulator [Geodermatophilus obscurus]|uniref:GntR family transcriptional regulator n=1 Tax=Geodermatophilus obscurus TaxID=1861 RepID=A0A1I5I8N5_9ACTN|nr:GntR family transcriptional regulator [Geodermatophilus obscurus]SFO56887.1 GntR family transcriptional regulator [Geodermatophilus obscurus]